MPNMENVIKELHDARRYLENKEWSDRGASPHIDAINDALALMKEQNGLMLALDQSNAVNGYLNAEVERLNGLLKEQEAVTIKRTKENVFGVYGGICPKCHNWIQSAHSFCGFCGQEVKWE